MTHPITACATAITLVASVNYRDHNFQCYIAQNRKKGEPSYRICADASSYCGVSDVLPNLIDLPEDDTALEALIVSEAKAMFQAQPHYVDMALLNILENH